MTARDLCKLTQRLSQTIIIQYPKLRNELGMTSGNWYIAFMKRQPNFLVR